MQEQFRNTTTKRDIAIALTTFVLTAALCMELWGEGRIIIDRTFTAMLSLSPEMYRYLKFTTPGVGMRLETSNAIIANSVLALASYFPYRLHKFVRLMADKAEDLWQTIAGYGQKCTPATPCSKPPVKTFAKHIPWWVTYPSQLLVLLGAVANGAMPAYGSYQNNVILSAQQYYARTIPPFLFIFYTLDSFLRLSNMRQKLLINKGFVARKDSPTQARARQKLDDTLRRAKYTILEMNSEALLEFLNQLYAPGEDGERSIGALGLSKLKLLLGLAEKEPERNTKRTLAFSQRHIRKSSKYVTRQKHSRNITATPTAISRAIPVELPPIGDLQAASTLQPTSCPPAPFSGDTDHTTLAPVTAVTDAPPPPKAPSVTSRLRQYGPILGALLACIPGAYLTGRVAYENFGGTVQFLATGSSPTSLIDRISINGAEVYARANVMYFGQQVTLWPNTRENITVYDGLGSAGNPPDWCWQCIGTGNYELGLKIGGLVPINFLRCPGVLPTPLFEGISEATCVGITPSVDLVYSEANCESWPPFFDDYFQSSAYDPTGQVYYRQGLATLAPHLLDLGNSTENGYVLPPAGKALAGIGGGISGLAIYGLGVWAMTGFFKRWMNSYRHHPDEVLPGKRNAALTTGVMSSALLQSVFRASPVLISGWMNMREENISPGVMWAVVSLATLTTASVYFADFDEVYSHLPQWLANDIPGGALKGFNWLKRKTAGLFGRQVEDTGFKLFGRPAGELVFPQRNRLLANIDDELRQKLAGADPELIEYLWKHCLPRT